ncbi:hypothetical protein M514_01147 [Trichuris suis]|uniref:Uncharacterized protein n=1 Tax=Trichuris suis TaxID=68888 RepID=A0A085NN64_9BILA|nr:hypothetical protein M513_01147 [Trichuris suis]KFD70910.1 hypothetical protein M514_01147 [Trichuris suis]
MDIFVGGSLMEATAAVLPMNRIVVDLSSAGGQRFGRRVAMSPMRSSMMWIKRQLAVNGRTICPKDIVNEKMVSHTEAAKRLA